MNHLPILLRIVFILIISFSIFCKDKTNPSVQKPEVDLQIDSVTKDQKANLKQEPKPDLIIESISYERYYNGDDGVVSLGKVYIFTLKIKNIGSSDFQDRFYISNTHTKGDIENKHFSHTGRVNETKEKIPINGSIEVKVMDEINQETKNIVFLINTDGKKHIKHALPRIEELNYDNNTYELEIIK